MSELKKCPFCGGDPQLRYQGVSRKYDKDTVCIVFVRCRYCKGQGPVFPDNLWPDEDGNNWNTWACECAASAWNRRANEIIT